MTRAGVFLTAALAAASLGMVAQDNSRGRANSPNTYSVEVRSHNTGSTPGQQSTPSPSSATVAAHDGATETSNSTSSTANETTANRQLPQTSTILPLLGLIGLGSLVAGLFARR
jgi:cobalamin biosynthesis Mg chelatase CobN